MRSWFGLIERLGQPLVFSKSARQVGSEIRSFRLRHDRTVSTSVAELSGFSFSVDWTVVILLRLHTSMI